MYITWYGQSCFKLQNKTQTVLIDPYSPKKYGLRAPNLKARLILLTNSEDEKKAQKDLKKECFLISSPGEYEIDNIFIQGLDFKGKEKRLTVYRLEMDNIRFGILAEIDDLLSNDVLNNLDGIDVLFIPVGGGEVIDSKKAIEIINSLEPKLAIPCCFKIPGLKSNLSPSDKFLKEAGIKNIERVNKLSIQKKHLLFEETKIVILEPGG